MGIRLYAGRRGCYKCMLVAWHSWSIGRARATSSRHDAARPICYCPSPPPTLPTVPHPSSTPSSLALPGSIRSRRSAVRLRSHDSPVSPPPRELECNIIEKMLGSASCAHTVASRARSAQPVRSEWEQSMTPPSLRGVSCRDAETPRNADWWHAQVAAAQPRCGS